MKEIMKVVAVYGERYSERSESFSQMDEYSDTTHPVLKPVLKIESHERDMRWLHDSKAVIAEVSGSKHWYRVRNS